MVILGKAKQFIQSVLITNGVSPDKLKLMTSKKHFSHFDEELIIKKLLCTIPDKSKSDFVIDIAAADGISNSNTYFLFKSGMPGLAIEYDGISFGRLAIAYKNFGDVKLVRTKVTPENILSIFESSNVPLNFALLNLDIDSYDYFVLDSILKSYRPTLICAEINEKIPPPLKFTVKYDPKHSWNTDHFFGQSISKLYELCEKFSYDLVELHYNNAFLIPKELNKNSSLKPDEAYDLGYKFKKDRLEKFPYNIDMDPVLKMSPQDAKHFIDKAFKKYQGKYDLSF